MLLTILVGLNKNIVLTSPQSNLHYFVLTFAARQLLQKCKTWPVCLFQHELRHPRKSSHQNLQLIAHTPHILY